MATDKPLPLSASVLVDLARRHGTPLYVYDAATIRARASELARLFDRVRYAQKANSNHALLELVRAQGCLVDAVSAGEVEHALAAGYAPHEIVFTSDLFDRAGLECVARHRVPVNLGSLDMLTQFAGLDIGHEITLRVNPGFGAGHAPGVATGGQLSKHGIWITDLERALARADLLGLRITGLHVHIGSGAGLGAHLEAAGAMRELALRAGRRLEVVSAGGGIPIPYRPGEARFELERLAHAWRDVQRDLGRALGHEPVLEVEPGRYLVAESGVLVAEVCATKRNGALDFVLVDAGFHNLPRPLLYGAYHAISALGPAAERERMPQVVAGPLCESSDVFTRDAAGHPEARLLPRLAIGDLVCLHDTGAYASSMASNYNAQPFAAEVLVDGASARVIRTRGGQDGVPSPG